MIYNSDEANDISQSTNRYRLIVFSNFLTELGTVKLFEGNILDILSDAKAGTVLLIIGGNQKHYPTIYEYVDRLAEKTNFQFCIEEQVSSNNTPLSDIIYSYGQDFYNKLQKLSPNDSNDSKEIKKIHRYFRKGKPSFPTSGVRAYRKSGNRGK